MTDKRNLIVDHILKGLERLDASPEDAVEAMVTLVAAIIQRTNMKNMRDGGVIVVGMDNDDGIGTPVNTLKI